MGPTKYKAAKKSDNGKEYFSRSQPQQNSNYQSNFAGLNNIFTGAGSPRAEPRAKLEEIQAPDLGNAKSFSITTPRSFSVVVKSKQSFEQPSRSFNSPQAQ